MNPAAFPCSRRDFGRTLAVAAAGTALTRSLPSLAQAPQTRIKLGLDNFAVRAMKWTGRQLVDYAASLEMDTLFITDLAGLGSLEEAAARELRRYAADKGIEILLGSWSICPTSRTFRKDWGTAEEHLALGLRLSKAVGSPAFRVVLGSREDRRTPGGIDARIEDTVAVLKSQRALAQDLGVKVAMENHAGDMTADELITLIEAAGRDWVGANMDSGNAVWTLEDPLDSLEKLGPYALTTSLRDSAIWETEKGCRVQWTAMGDGGVVDLKHYFARYAALCPGVAVNIETIGGFAVEFPYLEPSFWEVWPNRTAAELARFLSLAKRGTPRETYNANDPDRQREDLERSLRYCRDVLGLGVRGRA
ncbi:MAG: sugar phosphate isomerase/epimerase [Verrucomicrobiae bacterium]|nr:sugar phosphate isomerase/epimerase [Verrucomicrobiae bacterium]